MSIGESRPAFGAVTLCGALMLAACTSPAVPTTTTAPPATVTTIAVPQSVPATTGPTTTVSPESAAPAQSPTGTTTTIARESVGLGPVTEAEQALLSRTAQYEMRGFDLEQIVVNWVSLYNLLYQQPSDDPQAMYDLLYGGGEGQDIQVLFDFFDFVEAGWRYDGPQREIVAVRVIDREGPSGSHNGLATVEWADHSPGVNVVDESGAVIRSIQSWELRVVRAELAASRFDGRWRVLQTLEPQEGVSVADLEADGFTLLDQ